MRAVWIVLALIVTSAVALAQPAPPKPKGRDVAGLVLDNEGKPIANATGAVPGGGPPPTTAADGTFKLTGVPTTNLTLDVQAEGFTARQVPILGAATPLQLEIAMVKPPPPPTAQTRSIAGVVT